MKPGTHVDLIGAFTPLMGESDGRLVEISEVFVDAHEALTEAGDLVQAMAEGTFSENALRGNLTSLCSGQVTLARNNSSITLFKAVGTALSDLCSATPAFQNYCATASTDNNSMSGA